MVKFSYFLWLLCISLFIYLTFLSRLKLNDYVRFVGTFSNLFGTTHFLCSSLKRGTPTIASKKRWKHRKTLFKSNNKKSYYAKIYRPFFALKGNNFFVKRRERERKNAKETWSRVLHGQGIVGGRREGRLVAENNR